MARPQEAELSDTVRQQNVERRTARRIRGFEVRIILQLIGRDIRQGILQLPARLAVPWITPVALVGDLELERIGGIRARGRGIVLQ